MTTLEAAGDTEIDADGIVNMMGATLRLLGSHIELNSEGNLMLDGSIIKGMGDDGKVELESDGVIFLSSAYVTAGRKIEIEAADAVFSDLVTLHACGPRGKVEVEAAGIVSLANAVIRANREIEIESNDGDVDVTGASIGIKGGTSGDIEIEAGNDILVAGAEIKAPDDIDLNGNVVGDGTEDIGEGTLS